jgi:hypothetical protein
MVTTWCYDMVTTWCYDMVKKGLTEFRGRPMQARDALPAVASRRTSGRRDLGLVRSGITAKGRDLANVLEILPGHESQGAPPMAAVDGFD